MYGNGSPRSELLLRESREVAYRGENQQGYGIEYEDRHHREGGLVVIGVYDGGHGGYRAASADGGTGGDQVGVVPRKFEDSSEQGADDHHAHHRYYGEEHTVLTGLHGRIKIHTEAKAHDGGLQQVLRYFLGKHREG